MKNSLETKQDFTEVEIATENTNNGLTPVAARPQTCKSCQKTYNPKIMSAEKGAESDFVVVTNQNNLLN